MEGPSSKQANIYSDNPEIHNMDTFNHPAPPPAYQSHSYPPNQGSGATVIQHPTETVTQEQYPGMTATQQQYPGMTVTQQEYPGMTVTQQQYPGVTVTQQPGVTVMRPGAPVVGTTVVQTVYLQPLLGKLPTAVQCRSCNYQTTTRVKFQPSTRTHLCALLICLLFWPCVCVPYCTNECQAAQHYCSNCGSYIGSSP